MKTKTKIILTIQCIFFSAFFSNAQSFNAVSDTVYLTPGIADTVDLLANDNIPPGDSIYIKVVYGYPVQRQIILPDKKLVEFVAVYGSPSDGTVHGSYILQRKGTSDTSKANLTIIFHDELCDSITINNVNARFFAWGYHYSNIWDDYTCFEVPKGSGKGTIFAHSLWIGGKDETDQLHLAGYRYGQGPYTTAAHTQTDYWPGPVMDSAKYSVYEDTNWYYIWKLTKEEIEFHKSNWNTSGYVPVHDILTWPGNGDVSLGQAAQLAPYIDVNEDGIYNPYEGDFPNIRGDQTLFFIFNDDRDIHTETEGNKMKLEIHGMAYAFDLPHDSSFNNTIFLNYKLINRSSNTYTDTYTGIFGDFDIGYSDDDIVGCDVERGMFFGYNGKPVDGTGQSYAYGAHPPAQAIVFLGGPLLNPDQRDNPRFTGDCSIITSTYPNDPFAINGAGFGDTIVDNERLGMTGFLYCNNSTSGVPAYMTDPAFANEYYLYMQSIWKDSTKLIYGGNGHTGAGGYGPDCNFMYPDISDRCDWGTHGLPPNGPKLWTEKTAHNNPSDRRGVGSVGPFTLGPGEEQDLDLAFVFARDYSSSDTSTSLNLLGQLVDTIRHSFHSNLLPNGKPFLGIQGELMQHPWDINIFPNPASSSVTVYAEKGYQGITAVRILDSRGATVKSLDISGNGRTMNLDVSGLSSGLYLIMIQSKDSAAIKKLTIIR